MIENLIKGIEIGCGIFGVLCGVVMWLVPIFGIAYFAGIIYGWFTKGRD